MTSSNKNSWIWIDLEMTGLNPPEDKIIEMAAIVTDFDLNIIAESPTFAIHQPDEVLASMDNWCTQTHTESGLVERVKNSKFSATDGEKLMLNFLQDFADEGKSPMCGNSVHQDRRFLQFEMPELEKFFHYRNLDVTSIAIVLRAWKPEILKPFVKKSTHKAMDDIKESIEELRFYRQFFCDKGLQI